MKKKIKNKKTNKKKKVVGTYIDAELKQVRSLTEEELDTELFYDSWIRCPF